MKRTPGLFLIFLICFCGGAWAADPGQKSGAQVTVLWKWESTQRLLRNWTLQELSSIKRISSRERDPLSGKVVRFDGVSLAWLIDQAMETMLPEEKSVVDLVILRNPSGAQALIPRSFIQRYPAMLAMRGDRRSLGERGLLSVMPWTSVSKAANETLPLEHYFVEGVSQVELTNYRQHFEGVFLQKRSNPLAVRGEKIFVRTCLACHEANRGPTVKALQTRLPSGTFKAFHPRSVPGLPELSDMDQRGLESYFRYIQRENPAFMQKVTRAD